MQLCIILHDTCNRDLRRTRQHARAGQSHNEYFQYARTGQVRHAVGPATAVDEAGVRLADGSVLPADMVVYCGGFEFQGSPPFLAELGLGDARMALPEPASPGHCHMSCLLAGRRLSEPVHAWVHLMRVHDSVLHAGAAGFKDLHSYAFLGSSGRIGTASDVTVRYVPVGAAQQIDMFLRAHALSSAGRIAVRITSYATSPLPTDICGCCMHGF